MLDTVKGVVARRAIRKVGSGTIGLVPVKVPDLAAPFVELGTRPDERGRHEAMDPEAFAAIVLRKGYVQVVVLRRRSTQYFATVNLTSLVVRKVPWQATDTSEATDLVEAFVSRNGQPPLRFIERQHEMI